MVRFAFAFAEPGPAYVESIVITVLAFIRLAAATLASAATAT